MALIMIVDDEDGVRQVLARWIRGTGHQVGNWREHDRSCGEHAVRCAGLPRQALSHHSVIEAFRVALEWHSETVAAGPRPEDTAQRLQQWLDSLD
jgi:CheY-like chemotaxis protein